MLGATALLLAGAVATARAASLVSGIEPAESIALLTGESQYFYVGSTAGGQPMDRMEILQAPNDKTAVTPTTSSFTVSLSASTTSPKVGESVTLTATANQSVSGTGYEIMILENGGNIVARCSTGTSCQGKVSKSSPTSQIYQAYIGNESKGVAESNQVTVTWSTSPTVAGLSVKSGPTTGGTSVTITGTGFGGLTAVHFGPNEAIIKSYTETSITVESPAGTGTVYVTVTTPNGTSPSDGKGAKHAKFKYKKAKK